MANHPANLALRFFLELAGLFCFGYWGWTQHPGLARIGWTVLLPLVAAAAWGIFRVPGYPGDAAVPVPGIVRLLLELVYFSGAVWALAASGKTTWAWIFGAVVLVHYVLSYDYVVLMLKTGRSGREALS